MSDTEKCKRCGADPVDKAGNQFHSAQCLLNSKIEALQRRVKELEGLELVAVFPHPNESLRLSIVVPKSRYAEDAETLGDAMPRKGGV